MSAARRKRTKAPAAPPPEPPYYDLGLQPGEAHDLEAALAGGLGSEITLLRVVMRRLFASASQRDDLDTAGWQQLLNALGLAATRLCTLLRTQKELGGDSGDEVAAAIAQAISEVAEEMGLGGLYGPD